MSRIINLKCKKSINDCFHRHVPNDGSFDRPPIHIIGGYPKSWTRTLHAILLYNRLPPEEQQLEMDKFRKISAVNRAVCTQKIEIGSWQIDIEEGQWPCICPVLYGSATKQQYSAIANDPIAMSAARSAKATTTSSPEGVINSRPTRARSRSPNGNGNKNKDDNVFFCSGLFSVQNCSGVFNQWSTNSSANTHLNLILLMSL